MLSLLVTKLQLQVIFLITLLITALLFSLIIITIMNFTVTFIVILHTKIGHDTTQITHIVKKFRKITYIIDVKIT